MQPYRTLIVYTALTIILGAYIFFIAKNEKGTTDALQNEKNLFTDLPFSKVTQAKLIGPTGTFSFTKKNDRWRITSPIDTPADSPTIDMILNEIEFTQSKRVIPYDQINKPQETLQQWGLQPPTLSFEFTADNQTYVIHLGRKTAFSETHYARISNDSKAPVVLIPSTLHAALNRKLDDLRERAVFYDLPTQPIESIAFRSEYLPPNTTLQDFSLKLKDQKWTFERPFTARAKSEIVNDFIDQLTSLNSVNFITDTPDKLDKFGLDTPTYQITLSTSAPSTHDLLIGNPIPEQSELLYAKRLNEPAIFSIPRDKLNQLLNLIQEFRDLTIAAFSPDHVTHITLEKGRQTIAFTRQDSKWLYAPQNKTLADHIKIFDLLRQLQQTPALRVAKDAATELKTYGLDNPAARITLKLQIPAPISPTQKKDNSPPTDPIQQTLQISLGKIQKEEIFVSNNIENTVYVFRKSLYDALNLAPDYWRSLTLFPLESGQLKALTLTPKNQPPYTIERTSPSTFTTTLENTTLDNFKTETLFVRAASLQAVRWLNLPARTYQSPLATIKILADNNTSYTLTVATPLSNGNFPVLITPLDIQAEIPQHDILSLLSVPTVSATTSVTTPPVQAPPPPAQPEQK